MVHPLRAAYRGKLVAGVRYMIRTSFGEVQTPWGPARTPMAVLPDFYCPKCDKDIYMKDCSHNRRNLTPPLWVRQYVLWLKGKFEVFGELLEKFRWLRDNANITLTNPGFEDTPDFNGWTLNTAGTGAMSVVGAPPTPSEGSKMAKSDSPAGGDQAYCQQSFTASNTVYMRLYVYIDVATFTSHHLEICALYDGTGYRLLHVLMAFSNRRARIEYRTLVGTYTNVSHASYNWPLDQWVVIEMLRVKSATVGRYALWADETKLFDVTSLDTNDKVTDQLKLGDTSAHQGSGATLIYFDSVVGDNANYIGPIPAVVVDLGYAVII